MVNNELEGVREGIATREESDLAEGTFDRLVKGVGESDLAVESLGQETDRGCGANGVLADAEVANLGHDTVRAGEAGLEA